MDAFLQSIQNSGFARFVGESGSIWGYPTILFLHTLGLGAVAGLSAGVDLRLLGFGRGIALAPLDKLFSIMWWGFGISAASGTALLAADPVTKLHQVIFYVKLLFVALGVVSMQMIRNRVFRAHSLADNVVPAQAKPLAILSLVFWIGATIAGRLIAYL